MLLLGGGRGVKSQVPEAEMQKWQTSGGQEIILAFTQRFWPTWLEMDPSSSLESEAPAGFGALLAASWGMGVLGTGSRNAERRSIRRPSKRGSREREGCCRVATILVIS